MIVNLTRFTIHIGDKVINPSGKIAMPSNSLIHKGNIEGIDIMTNAYSGIIDLPMPEKDTFFIVYREVRMKCPGRTDLLSVRIDEIDLPSIDVKVDYLESNP